MNRFLVAVLRIRDRIRAAMVSEALDISAQSGLFALADPVYGQETYAWLLFLCLGVVLGIGALIVVGVIFRNTRLNRPPPLHTVSMHSPLARSRNLHFLAHMGPRRWLAVRSENQQAVMNALDLHNPYTCSWIDGLSQLGDHHLVISPAIQGWILVMGPGLPDPSEDADRTFHFLRRLSQQLGQIQFFSFNRPVLHQSWVRMFNGQVIRAYAWAGETVWNQGARTALERKLGMVCMDYGECLPTEVSPNNFEPLAANMEKIPILAAKWSLDPFAINDNHPILERGIAGKLFFSHTP